MPIQWREKLSVGHVATDDEHKHLVCLLNGLEVLVMRHPKRVALLAFLDEIEEAIIEHFHNEESLMLRAGYPNFEAHHQAHIDLKKQLRQIRDGLHGLDDQDNLVEGVAGLMVTIKDWLFNHILEMDRGYAAHLSRSLSPGLRGGGSRAD